MNAKAILTPFGILEVASALLTILDRVYETGIRLTKAALRPYQQRLRRSETLPKWSVAIQPQPPTAAPCD